MCKIGIFEDEPMIQMMWEDVVDALGYQVAGSMQNEEDGMVFAAQGEMDVGILDINLGEVRSDRILEILASRNIPVVVCSGLTKQDLPELFTQHHVLSKPFSVADAARVLAETCGRTVA